MRLRTDLNEKNWRLLAAASYANYQCTGQDEFESDLKRLKYIKKAVTRYKASGNLTERLILNHVIVLSNVLGPETATRVIWLKLKDHLDVIKPFLLAIGILPPVVRAVDGRDWRTDDVPMDPSVVAALRSI